METKYRFFRYDVLEDVDGCFQVNDRRLCRGSITLNMGEDGYVTDDDYDIIGAVHETWGYDCDLSLIGGEEGIIEIEEEASGCPIGQLVPENQICQPL